MTSAPPGQGTDLADCRIGLPAFPLDLDSPFHVAGHRGLVGSAIWGKLQALGHRALLGQTSAELDLSNRSDVFDFYATQRPRYVVLAAAKVGGIGANASTPADFISVNLQIQTNVLDAAHAFGVERLLFLGSSCIYPKFAEQPIREDSLLTGPLEPTNTAYAVAKIAGIVHLQSLRSQHGRHYISAMPTNLYGPEDNFDPASSHVLSGMLAKFHAARTCSAPAVQLWGTGTPRREFLYVDDLATACLRLLERYDDPRPINVGTGTDLTIAELARMIAAEVGFRGRIDWDTSKPDGTPRKVLDVSRIRALGWAPTISLPQGIASTYAWYRQHLTS